MTASTSIPNENPRTPEQPARDSATNGQESRTLSSPVTGTTIPRIGFGTYRLTGNDCFDATKAALSAGYRHIDTAMAYENEAAVGRAIAASSVDRDEVFITTKVKGYPEYLTEEGCKAAIRDSIDKIDSGPVDLLLVHWWNPQSDMTETFGALNDLRDDGYIREIGVSNFSPDQLRQAIESSDAPILTNQIEYHPYRDQDALLRACREHDVLVTAYSPLAEGLAVSDPTLESIGRSYEKSAAQVAIRWLLQQKGVLTIPKASTPSHLTANIDVFDFSLTAKEMRQISSLRGPLRYRLTADDGTVTRIRHRVGSFLPASIRQSVPF